MRALFVLCLFALSNAAVVSLTAENFDAKIKEGKPVLVKFFAPWCGHCKKLAPTYEEFSNVAETEIPQLVVAEVDCPANNAICGHVQGYPTVILYHDGAQTEFEGARTVDAMKAFINKNL
ncbi:protein disulfide isomerase, putative [Entamoeba invadens IP1]|uniref:Protein disulfide isomerase, putative n=1 Tax=Entamoeba invadens IP1 TaxID=370355 RepID=A0A0A1UAK1_ENTIV|nr:protein disulfide isomerase, putative [Entamoeba invadens IP1]ELP89208.1 protein disulfide isomerase, putative [Entamoeba invadens IP1]|eukprot:XP_004255979.1 protein disulfide isomerase, putative [Entamoeba invadens IP1]